jgi:hypothetical protein
MQINNKKMLKKTMASDLVLGLFNAYCDANEELGTPIEKYALGAKPFIESGLKCVYEKMMEMRFEDSGCKMKVNPNFFNNVKKNYQINHYEGT